MTETPAKPAVTPEMQHPIPPPQMAPQWRRAVLAMLWVVFALWVAALLWMYFREVYPRRHPSGTPPTALKD